MRSELLDVVPELLPELLELLFFGVATLGLSLLGVYIEGFALASVRSGDLMLGLWAGSIGVVALAFAYFTGTDKFAAKLRDLKRA
ncbi:hypothetical protein GJ633_10765 [Halorubrum sp. CBA1125]|uniref:hypothetical protein n=1 Tax=Halorubrum sp. CBA1125 TaxID=2668072 RepID=UPI00135D3750|nr:hypothetical protein [Halorubrum sp. CBA1125]MUW15085.1 hypothetical protein [Halorubrum sp. CBA1125]